MFQSNYERVPDVSLNIDNSELYIIQQLTMKWLTVWVRPLVAESRVFGQFWIENDQVKLKQAVDNS